MFPRISRMQLWHHAEKFLLKVRQLIAESPKKNIKFEINSKSFFTKYSSRHEEMVFGSTGISVLAQSLIESLRF